MTTTKRLGTFPVNALAIAVALSVSAPAFAITFNIGEVEGQFDSSLSVGASWGLNDADKDLISNNKLGGRGYTATGDDGRLNFKKGDTFSKIFKGVHDLELKYQDFGAFVRGNIGMTLSSKTKAVSLRKFPSTTAKRALNLQVHKFSMRLFTTTTQWLICRALCDSGVKS